MRVVNWERWQMTKAAIVVLLAVIGLICMGGDDPDGLSPMPSPLGVVVALSCAAALLYNIIQNDRHRRK